MRGKTLSLATLLTLGSVSLSFAAGTTASTGLNLSSVTVDLTPVYTLAATIVTAGVGMFAVRKVIKLMNRS